MVAALERLAPAAPFGDGTGPVHADVVEAAQRLGVPHDDDGLAGNLRGQKLAGRAHLIRAPHELPRASEDPLPLEAEDGGVGVHARRQGRGGLEVGIVGERHGVDLASLYTSMAGRKTRLHIG